ncbi:MAG: TlpA family protein disulfide reductase [Actinomycetota bacterium]|nr:TlpA family protein disulfide reductase [Actinomycetota bacterium]
MASEAAPSQSGRPLLRTTLILIPAFAFVALLVYAVLQEGSAPAVGDPAPDFEGPLLSGGSLSLSELDGKPVFLNFWWSGCEPCKDEAPLIDRAQRAYEGEIAFVGINIRDARADAVEFADRYDLDFPHVRDETLEIYRDYGLTGQPESFFIDQHGVIVEHVPGPLDDEALTQLLDVLVARNG